MNTGVFYKASTLQLFHQILDSGLLDPKGDLVRFIYHLLRQFFKKLQEYPLLIVDVFAPKSRKTCLELNIGRLEAEKAGVEVSAKKEKRYVLFIYVTSIRIQWLAVYFFVVHA